MELSIVTVISNTYFSYYPRNEQVLLDEERDSNFSIVTPQLEILPQRINLSLFDQVTV